MKTRSRGAASVAFVAELITLLIEGGRSVAELAEECGVNRVTMERYLRGLRRRKLTFWTTYKKDTRGAYTINCPQLAVAAGVMFDAPKPLTTEGRKARIRATLKKEKRKC